MGTRTSYAPGSFCWVDLSTSDPDAAKGFYAELFGWEYDVREGAAYSMAMVGGESVAAITAQQRQEAEQGVPPHFNSYVRVEDADATLAKAKALGAKTLAALLRGRVRRRDGRRGGQARGRQADGADGHARPGTNRGAARPAGRSLRRLGGSHRRLTAVSRLRNRPASSASR
jgi:predicted enzyme related to lactoylglutathione lyase